MTTRNLTSLLLTLVILCSCSCLISNQREKVKEFDIEFESYFTSEGLLKKFNDIFDTTIEDNSTEETIGEAGEDDDILQEYSEEYILQSQDSGESELKLNLNVLRVERNEEDLLDSNYKDLSYKLCKFQS